MPAASVRSTLGPVLGGASWDRTAPKIGSTVSFARQQGQVILRFSPSLMPMGTLEEARREGSKKAGKQGDEEVSKGRKGGRGSKGSRGARGSDRSKMQGSKRDFSLRGPVCGRQAGLEMRDGGDRALCWLPSRAQARRARTG